MGTDMKTHFLKHPWKACLKVMYHGEACLQTPLETSMLNTSSLAVELHGKMVRFRKITLKKGEAQKQDVRCRVVVYNVGNNIQHGKCY